MVFDGFFPSFWRSWAEHWSIQFFCIGDTRYRYRLRYSILGTRYSILLPNRYSILDTDTRYFYIRAETCTFSALVPLSPYKKFHFISIAHKQCHNISCQLLQCIACKKSIGTKSIDLPIAKVSPILDTDTEKKYLDTVSAIHIEYRSILDTYRAMLWCNVAQVHCLMTSYTLLRFVMLYFDTL